MEGNWDGSQIVGIVAGVLKEIRLAGPMFGVFVLIGIMAWRDSWPWKKRPQQEEE